jgi:hypothetical protein
VSYQEKKPMKNWFDIISPPEDIRKGHFDEAVCQIEATLREGRLE